MQSAAMTFWPINSLGHCSLRLDSQLHPLLHHGALETAATSAGDGEVLEPLTSSTVGPPLGLLLLSLPTILAMPSWLEQANQGWSGYWDNNWDRREINLRKKNEESNEQETSSRLVYYKAKVIRHIFLIHYSQHNSDGQQDRDGVLTKLGLEQAELTRKRLASLGLKFDKIVHSSMARVTETTDIISKHLLRVTKVSTDLLCEGAPIEPILPVLTGSPKLCITKMAH